MPSDDRSVRALEAVDGDRDTFRSAVARTVDEVGAMLERAGARERGERSSRAQGPMARGRIDVERFASLLGEDDALDPEAVEQLERAREVLVEVHEAGDDLYRVRLEEGDSLPDTVADATARLGRAFGADEGTVFAGVRQGDRAGATRSVMRLPARPPRGSETVCIALCLGYTSRADRTVGHRV